VEIGLDCLFGSVCERAFSGFFIGVDGGLVCRLLVLFAEFDDDVVQEPK
jgi:hypothetical protein